MFDTPDVRVRPLTLADLKQIAAIEASLSDGWDEARLAGQLAGAVNWHYVAIINANEEIGGYACGMAVAEEAELYRLVIRKDYRGKGKGAALLRQVLERLATIGTQSVFLEVRESNQPALALYARYGFIEVGRRRAYYAAPVEDAIIMERNNQKELALEEHQGH